MTFDTKQTLQQGVIAQKKNKLLEAEKLYKAILSREPKHPEANHYLGEISASNNKMKDALGLFKTALVLALWAARPL